MIIMINQRSIFFGPRSTRRKAIFNRKMDKSSILIIAYKRSTFLESRLRETLNLGARVYVFVDKAKEGHADQSENLATIEMAMSKANSLEGVRVAERNLGLKDAVIEAITWFFQTETQGIILEDDIEVDEQFYAFANQKLNQYKFNYSISSINASRFNFGGVFPNESYLSIFSSSWGWATWKDRWEFFIKSLDDFPKSILNFRETGLSFSSRLFWQLIFYDVYLKRIDTWDYIWLWCNVSNSKYAVVPPRNFSLNHGFGFGATNTKGNKPFWLHEEIFKVSKDFAEQLEPRGIVQDNWVNKNVHCISKSNLMKHFLKNLLHYGIMVLVKKRRIL